LREQPKRHGFQFYEGPDQYLEHEELTNKVQQIYGIEPENVKLG